MSYSLWNILKRRNKFCIVLFHNAGHKVPIHILVVIAALDVTIPMTVKTVNTV